MVAVIDAPDEVVDVDMDGVGPAAENVLAPTPQEYPVAVEDDDRMLAAGEDIDVIA